MRHIVAAIVGWSACMPLIGGCCADAEWAEASPPPRRCNSQESAQIDEDRRRLADGEPLKHHDSEEELRRHEFERDFYNDLYEPSAADEQRHRAAARPSAEQARRMFEGE